MNKKLIILSSLMGSLVASAQDAAAAPEAEKVKHWADKIHEMDGGMLFLGILMFFSALVMILTIIVVINAVLSVMNSQNRVLGIPEISLFGDLKKKFITGDVLPVERDEEIKLSHNYDGIVELDNSMPPWLRAIFGVTIGFAVVYMGYYYVLGTGKFQTQEYNEEMELAAVEMAEYQKKAANSINEESVVLEKDATAIASAKEFFAKNCKTCHGANAEGGAGPNLTDAYWLHGGSVKDIFKTIKYGVPEKGMIAWQQRLTPKEIQNMVGYIYTLQGTNPAGAKAPQGELYTANATPVASADSSAAPAAVSADTVK
ncbi:MAG: c-type cytochrome [Cytophagales bacterium]